MTRARHEHQIKLLDSTFGREFEKALARILNRRRSPLGFFTAEQIADIRGEMIKHDWFRHKLNRENRKLNRRAA